MGRAENRRIDKIIGKNTVDKVAELMSTEYTKDYINKRCESYKSNIVDALDEAMKNNGLSNAQRNRIKADMLLNLKRKVNGVE
jgi:hypothetical protein